MFKSLSDMVSNFELRLRKIETIWELVVLADVGKIVHGEIGSQAKVVIKGEVAVVVETVVVQDANEQIVGEVVG